MTTGDRHIGSDSQRRLSDQVSAREKLNVLHRIGLQFTQKPSPDVMKQLLSESSDKNERLAAIDNFPPDDMTIMPLLVKAIRSDDDLEVVATAFRAFDFRAKQSFEFPDYTSVLNWWSANHTAFDKK